ncbi:MAG: ribonuclease [Patescibacteria group bacterium]|nr:ribonuclease [Patescibacteria group bacterium]
MATKYIIGIDEAGRGPLAGPVTVGLLLVEAKKLNFLQKKFFATGVKDSKKLTAKKREAIWAALNILQKEGKLQYACAHIGPAIIDKKGISFAVKSGVAKVLADIAVQPTECKVYLDGLLSAPSIFTKQETIIRGDETEVVIALASVVAKVSRDYLMAKLALKYPNYGLEKHKGYGTKLHLEALKRHGLSIIHRRSYLGRLVQSGRVRDLHK